MLEFGSGNNDILTSGLITTGVVPRVSKVMNLWQSSLIGAVLATTDAAGVYGGATGSGIVGAWKVEVSNNFPSTADRQSSQTEDALNPTGTFIDVTANFIRETNGAKWNFPLTAITTPTTGIPNPSGTGGSAYLLQIVHCPFRQIRFTFTPASNQGALQRAAVFFVSKEV